QAMNGKRIATQKSLFPATFQMSPADAALLEDLRGDLEILGFEVEPFGKDSFVVHGTPADLGSGNEQQTIEQLLEQFKHFSSEFKFSKREKLLRSLAMQQAVKAGQHLSQAEMKNLVNDLFNCGQPNVSPAGNPIYIEFKKDYLTRAFGK
ncbi:MAG TPA: DNA mismatch repair protein MutL, partial [Parasegetibacter sp.]